MSPDWEWAVGIVVGFRGALTDASSLRKVGFKFCRRVLDGWLTSLVLRIEVGCG